jgi:protein arginine N-methyltransferase 1
MHVFLPHKGANSAPYSEAVVRGIDIDTIELTGAPVSVRVRQMTADDRLALFPSVSEYPVYDDAMYSNFLDTPARNAAYLDAIARSVRGRTVVDIGTGRDALWAIAAVRAGAAHAFAIEQLPRVAHHARAAVDAAGLSDRITVVTGSATAVSLPVPAEVCISEVVGNIAGAEGVAGVIADARARLCTPSAISIPDRCATAVAAVGLGDRLVPANLALAAHSTPYLRQAFDAVGHPFDVRLGLIGATPELLISTALEVERIELGPGTPGACSTVTGVLDVTRRDTLHGLLLWSRMRCTADGAVLDTLATPEFSWMPVFVPLSMAGVPVNAGDRVELSYTTTLSDDGVHPDYDLRGRIVRQGLSAVDISWVSPHHGRVFRASDVYRRLFPDPGHTPRGQRPDLRRDGLELP